MGDWAIGVNASGELCVTHNGNIVVAFTPDYTMELYMALNAYYQESHRKE